MKKKTTVGQQKQLTEETIFSMDCIVTSKNVQTLLNKNQSLIVDIAFVSAVFKIEPSSLRSSIRVESVGQGYSAYVDQSVFEKVKSPISGTTGPPNRPGKKLSSTTALKLPGNVAAYNSKSSAVMALLLHLLTNVKRKTGKSWTFASLKNMKELVLMVPVSRNNTTMQVTATLFRQEYSDGVKVMRHYLSCNGKAEPAFIVAVDDDGYFDEE